MFTSFLPRTWRRANKKPIARSLPSYRPQFDLLESRLNPGSVSPNAVFATYHAPSAVGVHDGSLDVTVFYTGGDHPVSGTVFIGRAGVLIDGVAGKADHPTTAADTSGNNLDGQGVYGTTNGAPYTGNVLATGPSTYTFHYTDADIFAHNGHLGVLDAAPTDVCVVMYHDSVGTLSGSHANHFSTGTTVVSGSTKSFNTDNSWSNHSSSYTPSGSTYNPCTLSAITTTSPDLSKIGDPEFIITAAQNTSESPIYLQTLTDSLGNNLLAAKVAPVTSITATLTPAGGAASPVTLKAGLAIPVGATLTVTEIRTVQAADPDPTTVNVTYTFNALANLTSPVSFSVVASDVINLFQPHVKETISVIDTTTGSTTKANVGDTLTYTIHIVNDSSSDSPKLQFFAPIDATIAIPVAQQPVIPDLNPGDTFDFSYTYVVTSSDFKKNATPPPIFIPLSNTVDVHFHPAPTGLHTGANKFTNNIHGPTNIATINLVPFTDLSVTKVNDSGLGTAVPGESISYTITVKNNGGATVDNVTLKEFLPPDLLNADFTPSDGVYDDVTGAWTGLNLAKNQTITMTVTGDIDPSACHPFTNVVKVLPPAGFSDPNLNNNIVSNSVTLTPQSDLHVTNSDSKSSVSVGNSTTYTIVVSNDGPSTAVDTQFHDLISGYLSSYSWTVTINGVISGVTTGGAVDGSGDLIDTFITLLPGQTATFKLTVKVAANDVSLQNTAFVPTLPGDSTADNIKTDIDNVI